MYVQTTFFPFPDQDLDGPDPSDSPGCPIPVPSDPHGKAEFLATVAPWSRVLCAAGALSAWRAGRGRGVGGSTGGRYGACLAALDSVRRPYGIGPLSSPIRVVRWIVVW